MACPAEGVPGPGGEAGEGRASAVDGPTGPQIANPRPYLPLLVVRFASFGIAEVVPS